MKKALTLQRSLYKAFCVLLLLVLCGERLLAETITVSSITGLQAAISKAMPGDIITLASGVYTTTADIIIDRKGTAEKPVTITAQATGITEITGEGGFRIASPAAYIIIKGFRFTHKASRAKTATGSSCCRWTGNVFETPGEGEYLTIAGSDHQVDHNTFQNKTTLGRFIAVRGEGSQIAERLWIHHNYFNTHTHQKGNGAESLQFGLSGFSLSTSNSIVEHNVFEKCDGENELISVKASGVTLRYNTIRDCPAQFTLRHGNRCQVYGNYFINTPGLRIFGDDHVIFSNYFENCNPAITIGNGDGEVADGAKLTSHDRPDRVLIAFNTLVNNQSNIVQGGRKDGLGATYITVANNIIQGGETAAAISGPYSSPVWISNILFDVKKPGDIPVTGYTLIDPKLAKDHTGTFHLQPGSPAIAMAKGSYPAVMVDMDGQKRKPVSDIGADEIATDKVSGRMLVRTDVGVQ